MTRWRHLSASVALGMLLLPVAATAQINQLLAQGEARANEGAQAQKRIEGLADQAAQLLSDYRTELKVVDGLQVYNRLIQRQIDNQIMEKDILQSSIDQVSLIERQIVPLMISMIDSLEDFVRLDVPFLPRERSERIERLRTLMERSDVTTAEQFRRVIEAYQIENEYGRTIEAYKGSVEVGGKSREVDFLRIGRVALLYQTVGGDSTGAWSKEEGSFVELPAATYKNEVAKGLRMAKKQIAPDLVFMPVPAPKRAGQ